MFNANSTVARKTWLWDILGLAAFLAVFYLACLNFYPLFTPDEGRYSEVAREMVATGDYITPRVNGVAFLDKPILYYWLQAAAIKLFGLQEGALRFFPALLGMLGCLITYLCGRLLFDRRTGLLAALILATTPLYFGAAHYANLDLEVAVLCASSLLFFITGIDRTDKLRLWLVYGAYVLAALAALTKGLIGLAFPCMIISTWIILAWRWDVLKKMALFRGIALFFLIVLPWYILVQKANPQFLQYFFVDQQVTRFLSHGEYNNKTPFWFYGPIILIGFFPWTAFLAQSLWQSLRHSLKSRTQYAAELFLLLCVGIIFIFFSLPRSKTIGYILPLLPPLALLIARYLALCWENAARRALVTGALLFMLLGSVFTFGFIFAYTRSMIPFGFQPFLFAMGFILLSAIISAGIVLVYRSKMISLFAIQLTLAIAFLTLLASGAGYLNENSIKPLATQLRSSLKPQDEIVSFYHYYQDLPIYLERRITIVADWQAADIAYNDNWRRELWYGMRFQKTDAWLINEPTFWRHWQSNKRVFVFTYKKRLKIFTELNKHYYLLGENNDIVLLSNHPDRLALNKPQT